MTRFQWTRVNSDINGNPRFVIHFLNLLTEEEKSTEFWEIHGLNTIPLQYSIACKRANKIGGRKYHTKAYGGGIVFSSYALDDTEESIMTLLEKERTL